MSSLPTSDVSAVPPPGNSGRRTCLLFAVLIALAASTVTLYRLGDGRTLTSHEGFLAITTREMLATGDWLVPRFGRVLRLTKPPLGYWSVALVSLPFGDVSEFTARLPSALSSLALIALIGWWAWKWYGTSAGLCAALVQATSLSHMLHAREATVDMLQCLLMTVAMALIAFEPITGRPGRVRWIGIYALLGVLFLSKFHFGPVLVLAPVCVFWVWERQLVRFGSLINPVGLLIAAGIALAWPLYLLQVAPESWFVWRHETLGRAAGEMRPEAWWYFLPLFFYLMLPWCLFYPAMLQATWKRSAGPEGSRERFLWAWAIVQTVLISLSSNKHKNYLVPALPALAILLGPALSQALSLLREHRWRQRWLAAIAILGALAGAAATLVLVPQKWPHLAEEIRVASLLMALGGSAIGVAVLLRRFKTAGVLTLAVYTATLVALLNWVIPGCDFRQPVAEFAGRTRRQHPREDILSFAMGQSTALFYLALPVHRLETNAELREELETVDSRLMVTFRYQLTNLCTQCAFEELDAVRRDHPLAGPRTDDLVLLRVRRDPARLAALVRTRPR